MSREVRIGLLVLAGLGALVFALLTIGSLGEPREELRQVPVADVLAGAAPTDRFGGEELRIVGWYAELATDCVESTGGEGTGVDWLERACPLRVLLPEQPDADVTEAELQAQGLRLAAPTGQPFPSRAFPSGPNVRLEQLVFIGHFNDRAAAQCAPVVRERCRNAFVVSDYDGLVR